MSYLELMTLIFMEAKELKVSIWEYNTWKAINGQAPISGHDLDKNGGTNKTAIRRKILSIRQHLLELDKCFR